MARDRVAANRPFYASKHKQHGMNEGVAEPDGEPLWTTWSLPRAVHDNRAARVWKSAEHIRASDLLGLGDKGYVGLSELVFCPFKGRDKPQWEKDSDSEHAKLHSLGERTIAQFKNRDVLRRLRCCPHKAGQITRAVLVLQLREAG
ncbi:transposase family protein [Nocardiopsis alba]|uniref:transposase family protein n=1 Tax=Nocardiopsis alba TaxID=53437 RepID=UPI0033BFBF40